MFDHTHLYEYKEKYGTCQKKLSKWLRNMFRSFEYVTQHEKRD